MTLRDVALGSGVSITTVSRILNGRESGVPIRDETRQRVLSVAAELGYKPNLLARGLRGSRSSLIGVIARDVSDPFHIQILRGINAATRLRDYRLFLGHVDYRPDIAIAYGSMFERSHADGIIVIGDMAGDEALGTLADQHRFVIGVSDRIGPRDFPGVYSDSVAGTDLALDHLWSLGHRRIACVYDRGTHDQRQRAESYERFMADHGAGDHIRLEHAAQPDPDPSYRLGLELFAGFGRPADPSAIFADLGHDRDRSAPGGLPVRRRGPGSACRSSASMTSTSRRSRSRRSRRSASRASRWAGWPAISSSTWSSRS